MLDLILEVCLLDDPGTCASRLLPGPCAEADALARAEAWAEPRGLRVASARCGTVEPLEVAEIAPGIFVHEGALALADPDNRGDVANLGFVVGDDAVAVIDAGGSRAVGERLYAAVRAATDLPIRWVVLTHMHPDHTLGASVFAEAGATLLGHENLPAALDARSEAYLGSLEREAGPAAALGTEIVLPDETVSEMLLLDLGGRSLALEAHPVSHTSTDLTALDTRTGTLWTGDVVFSEHLPTIDGSVLGWLALLDGLADREFARIIPGHGPPGLAWPEGAAPMRAYLRALVDQTRAAVARGDSMTDAVPVIGRDLRGEWRLFDVFHPRNVTAAFGELEWE